MIRHTPDSIHPPLARYAHAVEMAAPARLLFVSGQLALSRSGDVPNGVEAQATLIFANLDAILASARMSKADITRISAFLVDRGDLKAYMAARDRWLDAIEPTASTLLLVQGFSRVEFRVEIELIAARAADDAAA